MISRIRCRAAVAAVAAGLAVAGCASTSALPGHHVPASCAHSLDQGGPAADPVAVNVVCHWADDLRAGDVTGAARLFHLPSVFADGGQPVVLHTFKQAEFVNASLPCGARVLSAFRDGRLVNVLFELTSRKGRGGGARACGTGTGETARTAFLIRNGQIVQWLRAASQPGDQGAPTTSSSPPTGPSV